MVIKSQTRVERIRLPPRTIKATPPRSDILPGASRPNLIFSDISLEGAENPSWAQRKGRTNSSLKFLKYLLVVRRIVNEKKKKDLKTNIWPH